jgi:hypothetical protein
VSARAHVCRRRLAVTIDAFWRLSRSPSPAAVGTNIALAVSAHGDAMLRVTRHDTPESIRLTFEGRLIGAWVAEADGAWHGVLAASRRLPIFVNLCDVSAVDSTGRELLRRMHERGVVFEARGCAMRELVREIEHEVEEAVCMGSNIRKEGVRD